MPVVTSGNALRINVRTEEAILTVSEGVPTVDYVAGGSIVGVQQPKYGSRALSFGPPTTNADVVVGAPTSDVDFEILPASMVLSTAAVEADIGPNGLPTGAIRAGGQIITTTTVATALADIGAGNFLLEQASAGVLAGREIGFGTDGAVLTAILARQNFLRVFSTMPSNSIGANGERGLIWLEPDAFSLIERIGGVWTRVAGNSGTFAEMQALSAPYDGQRWFVTTINFGASFGTAYPLRKWYVYDGAAAMFFPESSLHVVTVADGTLVTNSVTTHQASLTIRPPLKFCFPGAHHNIQIGARRTAGTVTAGAEIKLGAAELAFVNSTHLNSSVWRGRAVGHSRTVDNMRFYSGGTNSWAENNAPGSTTVQTAAFTGSNDITVGFQFSAADSTTTWTIDYFNWSIER